MNAEIGAEAALFPEKEYISGIFVAVYEYIFYIPTDKILVYLCKIRKGQVSFCVPKYLS
jgi:hypothetical protein